MTLTSTMRLGASVQRWSIDNMMKAAMEFEVPAGTKIVLIFPEIFERDILLQDPKFHVKYTDKSGRSQLGVKTPCPWCKSNEWVALDKKTGYKAGQHRTICDYRTRIPVYCFIGSCSNKSCIGNPQRAKNDGVDKAKVHQFHIYEPRVWSCYPKVLRDKYSKDLFTEAATGAEGEIFVTQEFCCEILRDGNIFLEVTRYMAEAYDRHLRQAIEAYINFATSQQSANLSWPDFCHDNFERVFKPPGVKVLKKIFDRCFDLVFPYLQRDLFSRVPGRVVKMDGTFEFLKKTNNDVLSEEEIKCLHIVWGQYGHILS